MSEPSKGVAGVDVGKATLVVARSAGPAREFANTPAGRGQLLAWLEHLVDERVWERNCLEREKSFPVEDSLFRPREWLDREIEQRDRQYKELLESSQALAPAVKLYCSVRGVGIQTAATLLAWLPELGRWEGKALTALAGLAPWPKDSGQQQGYRAIRGGRSVVRRALSRATLTARRGDNTRSCFYYCLRERGKPGKVAMVAALWNLLLPRNAIARRGVSWTPQHSPD